MSETSEVTISPEMPSSSSAKKMKRNRSSSDEENTKDHDSDLSLNYEDWENFTTNLSKYNTPAKKIIRNKMWQNKQANGKVLNVAARDSDLDSDEEKQVDENGIPNQCCVMSQKIEQRIWYLNYTINSVKDSIDIINK